MIALLLVNKLVTRIFTTRRWLTGCRQCTMGVRRTSYAERISIMSCNAIPAAAPVLRSEAVCVTVPQRSPLSGYSLRYLVTRSASSTDAIIDIFLVSVSLCPCVRVGELSLSYVGNIAFDFVQYDRELPKVMVNTRDVYPKLTL